MSEHGHEWQLDVKGNFYYCTCGKADLSITGLMVQWNIAKKRIKALEGVVELAKLEIGEFYYALVGGNTANESIERDVVGSALVAIKRKLEEAQDG